MNPEGSGTRNIRQTSHVEIVDSPALEAKDDAAASKWLAAQASVSHPTKDLLRRTPSSAITRTTVFPPAIVLLQSTI